MNGGIIETDFEDKIEDHLGNFARETVF